MRCPKCHYISYDSQDRCRNCGYEFSFSVDVEAIDLPMQTGEEPLGPLEDLSLRATDNGAKGTSAGPGSVPDVSLSDLELASRPGPDSPVDDSRVVLQDLPAVPGLAALRPSPRDVHGIETSGKPEKGRPRPATLPFNDKPARDASPLVPPSAPRPPLSVRRPTPAPAPRRPAPPVFQEPELDLELPESSEPASAHEAGAAQRAAVAVPARHDGVRVAPAGPRLGAAAIDASILGGIDAGVLYLTLRLCGLTAAQVGLLPAAPMIAFLLLLAGGYLVAFTAAGGQTIGKMAVGIKVVPVNSYPAWDDRVPLGVAMLRAAACLVSLITAGLGFVPALFGPGHRALHDRFADTRVVRA